MSTSILGGMLLRTALQKQGCSIKVGHYGSCTWSQMRSHFFSLSYCRRRRALSGGRFIEFWKTESAFASEHTGSRVFRHVPMATTLQRRLCARFLWVTVVSCQTRETLQPISSRPVVTSYILFKIIFIFRAWVRYHENLLTKFSISNYIFTLFEENYEQCLPLSQLWVIARALLYSCYRVRSVLLCVY